MADKFSIELKNKSQVIKWLQDIREGTGDARPLWKAVSPKIIEFVEYEVDSNRDAHKLWKKLTPKYLAWKIRNKGVSGIGYLSGSMRRAMGKEAIKEYNPKNLLWKINTSTINSETGKPVSKYIYAFHYGRDQGFSKGAQKILKKAKKLNKQPARPLYKYTALRLNNFLKLDVKQFSNGTKHANFTYAWLKKYLEVK
jgi:hypothetical protein